jgi:ubiquinone/menaquinone biosynthesis C-methylase UbiE
MTDDQSMTDRDQYVLGYRQQEQERLQKQAEQLAPESSWLFDQLGDLSGAHVAEIGCGPHGCLELLSQRVGPSGSVVGVERSPDAVSMARELIAARGLNNVDVVELDARSTGLPRASFDVVTARLVLVNIPDPAQVLAEAVALARPGGWVAFHEADYMSHVCDPPLAAWSSLVELLVRYSENSGIDPFIGRKLPRMLREAGLGEIGINPIIHVYPPGHGRRTILLDFADNLTERILEQGLVDESELTAMKTALRLHLDEPSTLVVSHTFFQVWGRTPR